MEDFKKSHESAMGTVLGMALVFVMILGAVT
jgi:hypothetical protein